MSSVSIEGTTFEYTEVGSGSPVVFVHGSSSDYRTWQNQQNRFGERFRARSYSRRYHWPNERILQGRDYSMAEQVDDLQAFLHSLEAAPAHLVGHSYGAFLCLLLAIRESYVARTLVLAEPPVVPLFVSSQPKLLEILKLLVSRPRTAFSIVKFGATGLNPAKKAAEHGDLDKAIEILGKTVLGGEAFSRLSESRLEQVRANAIEAEFLGSGFAPLDSEDVRRVRVPLCLSTGSAARDCFITC